MVIMQNGDQIAGGGLPVITVPYATYIANKAQYDAPDVLVRVPDYPKGKMPASYVGYDSHLGMGDIGNIATKSLGKVEYKSDDKALYPHTVGEFFINKNGEYCKCTSAISVNQTLVENTNYIVRDVASELQSINSDLSDKENRTFGMVQSNTNQDITVGIVHYSIVVVSHGSDVSMYFIDAGGNTVTILNNATSIGVSVVNYNTINISDYYAEAITYLILSLY